MLIKIHKCNAVVNKKHEMLIQEPSLQITLNIAKPTDQQSELDKQNSQTNKTYDVHL